jgi:hypothetical protein
MVIARCCHELESKKEEEEEEDKSRERLMISLFNLI